MYDSFDEYIEYMKVNKGKFPAKVYDFVTDVNRHNLNSPHSLHDSWMTSISIKENRNKFRPFDPKPSIELELLGQMHDRDIILTYSGIEKYKIKGLKNPLNYADTYQGDILCHQVTLNKQELLIHEILFRSESKIVIICENFDCIERMHMN